MVTHLPRSRGRGRAARGGGTLDTSTVQGPWRVVCKRSACRVTNDRAWVSCSWGGRRLEQPRRSVPSAVIFSSGEHKTDKLRDFCHLESHKRFVFFIKRQFFRVSSHYFCDFFLRGAAAFVWWEKSGQRLEPETDTCQTDKPLTEVKHRAGM